MDLAATYSREITGNRFGDNARIHQGDNHYYSPNDKTRKDEDTKCLADLRTTDPRHDKIRIEATKGGLFKDSYRWVLEHSDFRQWRDDESSRLLWIKGDPGKGKTMLLCGIINELSCGTRLKDQRANTLLSYFFCQAADERINSATAVLRGLIYLIVEQQPSLISHVQEKYKHAGKSLFEGVNAWTALSGVLENILNDLTLERIYVIIDALDECKIDQQKLLDFIHMTPALFSRVKWIVSSHNRPDIKQRLDTAAQQMRLCLELNETSISAAVNAYIEHQMVQNMKSNAKTGDDVQRRFFSEVNNLPLWTAFVCKNLEKIPLWEALVKLNKPPGLDSLYKRMMEQIRDLEDASDANLCYQILATVLLVYRPVTLAELGSLVKYPDGNPADAESIQKAIRLCGSFLIVRDGLIDVIHQSAKDYLNDRAAPTIFPTGRAVVHDAIFSQSLQAMSATLRRNIYNLHPYGISEFKIPDPDPLAAIRYSCVYWVDHFRDMHSINSQPQDHIDVKKEGKKIYLFLKEYFLYWLEALGLIQRIKDGVLSMIRLENLLGQLPHQSSDRQFLDLIQDSRRFIRQNSLVIAKSPLQVYTSALIFSPFKSVIREMCKKEEPQWLKTKPKVEDNWNPYLQTLEGHEGDVNSVAFSADGRYIASGSDDKTVKIWDATAGEEQQKLNGHSNCVTSVAFSADGRYVASGSDDKTVKIWDATTGKERQTLEGHSDCITSVAFSADGRYIASGSDDKTVKIWAATTGKERKERQTLKGHSSWVRSVAFSADGRYIASGSDDKTVKIWDATTGKEQQTLEGHSDCVYSVAFSADGRYIASGSDDKTVKIWDATAGEEQQTLVGYSDWVRSIAFSADGRYVASGSHDKTVKIWDVITGEEQRTLVGYSDCVRSIAFSADDRYIALGLDDNTVKIWDVTTGEEQQTLEGQEGCVNSIAFSADGRYIASGSHDKTVKIWDTTGKEQQTLKGHKSGVNSVAFSMDGRYIASGSDDKMVKIWDATTGKEQQTLKGHSDCITSVAFSADGRYIASGSHDKTVKIWAATTGKERKERQTLKGHSDWVRSVAFSADGRYIASGSNDNIVKIWDATTGKERKERQTLKGHSNWVRSVAFSADGRYVASGSDDKMVKIWNATTGEERQTLEGHSDCVTSVAFSADGRYIASGSDDKTVKIWDATTGKEQQTLKVYTPIHYISFSYLHTETDTIKISIDTRTEAQSTMVEHYGYGLSADECWITWKRHNILWLPHEYRPSMSDIWFYAPPSTSPRTPVTDVIMALCSQSGRVVVFRMSGSGP